MTGIEPKPKLSVERVFSQAALDYDVMNDMMSLRIHRLMEKNLNQYDSAKSGLAY